MTAPLDDDDVRAVSTMLGSQYAILRMPGAGMSGWTSDDELAAVHVMHTGGIVVTTAGVLTAETALALAAAVAEQCATAFALENLD